MYTCIMNAYQYQEYCIIIQNTHQDETVRDQSTVDDHADESVHSDDVGSFTTQLAMCYYETIFYVQSTPPLPPRLNYAELQLTNDGPKRMHVKANSHVTYVETKSA